MFKGEIDVAEQTPPTLSVVIHTEEEFDWSKKISKYAMNVGHIQHIDLIQDIFEKFNLTPLYVVDYPVAVQESSACVMRDLFQSEKADIGAHLQPWVSPPFGEELNTYNSFPGNLPEKLERAKLNILTETIVDNIGARPKCYLAGRYGAGRNTTGILKSLGYKVDLSASPPFDYSHLSGPDYSRTDGSLFWLDNEKSLLAMPGSGAFVGSLSRFGRQLHKMVICKPFFESIHLPGIFSKLGLLSRIRLSPEGYSQQELRVLTKYLLLRGIRHFTFSFHSPSIVPGNTVYVQNKDEQRKFFSNIHDYLEYFVNDLGGISLTPTEVHEVLTIEQAVNRMK